MIRIFNFLFLLIFAGQVSAALLSPRIYNKLNNIQVSINEQPDTQGLVEIEEQLIELAEDLEGNSLGLALTWQTHAQLKIHQDSYSQAGEYLKKAVVLKGLDTDTQFQLKSFLAQVLLNLEKYSEVTELLNTVVNNDQFKTSAPVYALLAVAHYYLEQYKEGLPFIIKACELSGKPKESWLQMAFSGSYQQKKYVDALHFTNQLLLRFPDKKDYWRQKAGLHQMLEEYADASVSKELSFKKRFIAGESEYINLGRLLASQGEPLKVANILQLAIEEGEIQATEKSLRLLQQAWMQAKEMSKSRAILNKLFDEFNEAKDGIRLMQFQVDAEQWQQALAVSKKITALKLSEKQKGSVLLLEGVCQYRLGHTKPALNALSKAMAIKSTASQAKGWMNYIRQMQRS